MTRERASLGILLIAYLLVGSLFAMLTPAWQVPDEPAHYNYARQLATSRHRCCPTIEAGDWDQRYLAQLTGARFAPDLLAELDRIQYEDHQPPLYYQMAALIYAWTGGSLIAMRLFSVLLGAGVVLCAWVLGKTLLPDRPAVVLGAAAFVAFLPQHVAMLAAVNNDSLTELLIGITLVVIVWYLRGEVDKLRWLAIRLALVALAGLTILLIFSRMPTPVAMIFLALLAMGVLSHRSSQGDGWQVWLIGLLIGIIFTTKSTGYFMAGLALLALFIRWWQQTDTPRDLRHLPFRSLLNFLIPALLLGALWWGHNVNTYGFPDFLGLGAHDRVVADQPRTGDRIDDIGLGPYLADATRTTFNSFWGQFGWMALPLQGWMYALFGLLSLAVSAGLLIDYFILQRRQPPDSAPTNRPAWVILWLGIGLTGLAYLYYNSEFLQPQGRYLFPALIPLGLLMALGVDAWRRWLLPRVALAGWLPVAVFGLLAPFDLYLLLRVIRPLLLP